MTGVSERALTIECTRIYPDDAARERIRAYIVQGIDWGAFLQFAIPHGILPLAARSLRECAEDLTPHATLMQLDMVLARGRLRYSAQCVALGRVMHALQCVGIRALAYKGPALIAACYPDPGLREFHDLDIWTAPTETAAAGEVLRALGYQPSTYREGEARPGEDRGRSQVEFVSGDGQVVIDLLNLELAPQLYFCPAFEELWERRRTVDLAGVSVPTLSTEDLLPALAVHGSKHYWRRLNWLVDLTALLASSGELDWHAVLGRAQRWRAKRRLLCALAMQVELYGEVSFLRGASSAVPLLSRASATAAILQQTAGNAAVLAAARQATQRLLHPPAPGTLRNAASVFLYHSRCTDRWQDRASLAQAELARRCQRAAEHCTKSFRARAGKVLQADPERSAEAQ